MKLQLDTHALLRWLADDDQLGLQARELIADPDNEVLISVVSLWEIVVKVRIGKLEADIREVADTNPREGFAVLGISTAHLVALARLSMHHRDPFDRLHMAQTIEEDANFISADRSTSRYPARWVACAGAPASPAPGGT